MKEFLKKKSVFFLALILLLFFVPNSIRAINVGFSQGVYDGVYGFETNETITIKSGKKTSLVVEYSYRDTNLGKIDVTFSMSSSISVATSSEYLEDGDTITKSGSTYTININSTDAEFGGVGVFTLTMPSPSETTKYDVVMTAKAYNKSGTLIETKTGTYPIYVLVRPANCDNNLNFTISSNLGALKKVNDSYYSLSTDESAINLTLTPANSTTTILYWGYMSDTKSDLFNTGKTLTNNSTGNVSLGYGPTIFSFTIEDSVCAQKNAANRAIYADSWPVGINMDDDIFLSSRMISVDITRNDNRSKVNTLKSLEISDVTIEFKPELKNYIVTVPYKVSSVDIKSELTDEKSTYVKGYGNRKVDLKDGLNTVLVKVKAENGSEATYTIKITRDKNDDSSLKSITVDDKNITLKSGLLIYSIDVANDVTKPVVKAVANDSNAKVEIDNITELNEGSNKINITVTAQNETKSIYVVDIVRDKVISTNSKLKTLTVKDCELEFDASKTEYTVHVNSDVDKLDITAETDNEKAKYIVAGNKNLKNGSVVKVKVTAEDGVTETTYSIKIEKEDKSFNILFVIIPVGILLVVIIAALAKKGKKPTQVQNNNVPANNEGTMAYNNQANVGYGATSVPPTNNYVNGQPQNTYNGMQQSNYSGMQQNNYNGMQQGNYNGIQQNNYNGMQQNNTNMGSYDSHN